VLNKQFCYVIVELLQSLESKACEKLSELPKSSESYGSSATDAAETVDGDKMQDGHLPPSNMMISTSGSDDNNAIGDVGVSIDVDTPVLCRDDLEADPGSKPLQRSTSVTESVFSDILDAAQMDQCENSKSDSGCSSPCSASADDIDTEKTPGILLQNCLCCRTTCCIFCGCKDVMTPIHILALFM